ncbi:MAG: hypothetical protein J6P44_07490 [Bacteroidales bacterium]|nr:hypothetical protein [Bacteroidales bacterium]
MNFELYIFEKAISTYSQYVEDSAKDIFQNIEIQSEEQLSIYHDETLVYYIYTKQTSGGYIGFSIVFNGVIYQNFAHIYTLFKNLTTVAEFYKVNDKTIIGNEFYQKCLNIVINDRFDKHLFVTCDKPTYNLVNESSVSCKTFDTSGMMSIRHVETQALINAIRQYRWVFIIPQENETVNQSVIADKEVSDNTAKENLSEKPEAKTGKSRTIPVPMFLVFLLAIGFFIFVVINGALDKYEDSKPSEPPATEDYDNPIIDYNSEIDDSAAREQYMRVLELIEQYQNENQAAKK